MQKFKYYLSVFFCFGFFLNLSATHNRAGEITYKWVGPGLYTYQIKITTYTNISIIGGQTPADRCEDTLYFGDGTRAVVLRSNGPIGACAPATDGIPINSNIKLNEYVTTHTYPGPGNYKLSMEDPNRNAGINNIPNSVNQVFYIESFLVIPFFGSGKNSSPILSFPPIDNGCAGKCFIHNPGAYDVDGDSISYELTTSRGHLGETCPGYTYPATGGGKYEIDPVTGTLIWCTPQLQDEYNLAILIKEWRKDDGGDYYLIGYILRDLQVDVGVCNNHEPTIKPITDTCVVAGTSIIKLITATDPDTDILTMEANGGPFGAMSPIATFSSPSGLTPISGLLKWNTTCSHIRKAPYQVTVKVKDNDPYVSLVDFKTFNVTVVPPAPLALTASPVGTSVFLKWKKSTCNTITGNKIEKYCIYRKTDCIPWTHGICEVGIPEYTGFKKVGCTSSINDTSFIDNDNSYGLAHGVAYSYLVEAIYTDGAESYASNQVCVQLKRDVPIIVNVDVKATASDNGSVFVRWLKPLLGNDALDTISIQGPYEFRLLHYNNQTNQYITIYSVSKSFFASFNQLSDTTYIHQGAIGNFLNTKTSQHTYKVEFYANGQFIGNGQKASSVFLSSVSSDNKIQLSWQCQVPWKNNLYSIYRKNPNQNSFFLKDSTIQMTYTDTGLVNGASYCYKIESKGQFSDPQIFHPLFNFSQEVCETPKDTKPPCAPKLQIQSDCQTLNVILKCNNPNHSCSDDALKYYIYFASTESEELTKVDSVMSLNDTVLVFDHLTSIAGCYAITAIDSFANESSFGTKVCIDNCPEYELPNVITINNDGVNEIFKPIKNKFIKDIDLKIYNRWGNLIFETTDPSIMWDGKVMQTNQLCSQGTYFYHCQVNEIRLSGKVSKNLKGFIHVFINK